MAQSGLQIPKPYEQVMVYNATTVTTGNVSASVRNHYNCTIAGMTANRQFVLPAPSIAGERISMYINDGDSDYALIPIGDTGITINGGAAATEAFGTGKGRLFIAGEGYIFESSSTSNWNIIEDGRIPCRCKMHLASAQTVATATNTIIEHDTEDWDIGSIGDLANYRFVIRRANDHAVKCAVTFNLDDQDRITTWIMLNAAAISRFDSYHSASSASNIAVESSLTYTFAIGDLITHQVRHEYGADRDTYEDVYRWPRLSIEEVF